jgi:hypothetical protein
MLGVVFDAFNQNLNHSSLFANAERRLLGGLRTGEFC